MKREFTKNERIFIAVSIIIATTIICAFVIIPSGIMIISEGHDMSRIMSVSGNTITESYYQSHGKIYENFGKIIVALGFAGCISGGLISGWILKPAISKKSYQNYFYENNMPINNQNTTAPNNNIDSTYMSQENSVKPSFCPNCGSKIENESLFCPNCGKSIYT